MTALPEKHRDGQDGTLSPGLPLPNSPLQASWTFEAISRPYAGRVSGNWSFALSPDTPAKAELLSKISDAAPYLTWRESFDPHPFFQPELWKQALVEYYATTIFVFLNGWVDIMNMNTATWGGGSALTELVANIIGGLELMLSIALLVYTLCGRALINGERTREQF